MIVNDLGAPLDILSQGADIYGRVQDARRGPARPAPVTVVNQSAEPSRKSPLAWIILGLAGVGLVVGGGMFLRSRNRVRTNPPRRARRVRKARRAR